MQSKYINAGQSLQTGVQLGSLERYGSRRSDYVQMSKRDSQLVSSEQRKMQSILSDIKQDKKYEQELQRKFSKDDQSLVKDLDTVKSKVAAQAEMAQTDSLSSSSSSSQTTESQDNANGQ